jgi:hypothetical protein
MSTKEALVELDEALTRFEGIEKRIVSKQPEEKAKQGRERLALLRANLVEAKTQLGAEPDSPTIPGPYPDTMPKPPDPTKVTSGKTYTGDGSGEHLQLAGLKNHAFVKNKFINTDRLICHGDCGRGVIIAESFVDGLRRKGQAHGAHPFFPGTNWQTSDDVYDLWFMGLEFGKNNDVDDEFEVKGSSVHIIGCQGSFKVRIRHGVGTIVANNPECANVSVRCGPHFIGYMPKCRVIPYSGNLDGRKGHWEPNSGAPDAHQPSGGHNMQSAVETSIVGVASITLGFHFGENDKKYPPLGMIIDPSLKSKTKIIAEKGTRWEPVKGPQFKALQALERLQTRRERDVAEAPRDDRNREDEVYDWFMEYNANLLRQAGAA